MSQTWLRTPISKRFQDTDTSLFWKNNCQNQAEFDKKEINKPEKIDIYLSDKVQFLPQKPHAELKRQHEKAENQKRDYINFFMFKKKHNRKYINTDRENYIHPVKIDIRIT